MIPEPGPAIVLASASPARQRLLRAAGVPFRAVPVALDERAIAQPFDRAAEAAMALARAKALAAAERMPGHLVIGADQILTLDDLWFSKPAHLAAARSHLSRLSARTHVLETAVAVVRDGAVVWTDRAAPRLTMRALNPAEISHYLADEGEAVLDCVGAYRIEGPGVRLFTFIDGDRFAIEGLPLLPLLGFLRTEGVLAW